jgi:hypothetical protein
MGVNNKESSSAKKGDKKMNNTKVEMAIPERWWPGFKAFILATNFFGDPVLTKHNQDEDPEYVYAAFESDCERDVRVVLSVLIALDGNYVD